LLLPLLHDLSHGFTLLRGVQDGKLLVHHEFRQVHLADVRRQLDRDPGTTGDQNHFVSHKGLADFKASEKMANSQDMLAVINDLHRFLR
jgi:hypothetical protein